MSRWFVRDFPRGKVLVKVGVMEFGLLTGGGKWLIEKVKGSKKWGYFPPDKLPRNARQRMGQFCVQQLQFFSLLASLADY